MKSLLKTLFLCSMIIISSSCQKNLTNLTLEEAFTELAKQTKGQRYNTATASELPGIIEEALGDHGVANADIVFLIDNTGSMYDDISAVKSALDAIISALPSGCRIAVCTYADKNEDVNWFTKMDFTTNYNTAKTFINDIGTGGGGDIPESVYDGIFRAVDELSWDSDSKRMMLVIGDAAPLDGELTDHTFSQVVSKCKSTGLLVNLYPVLVAVD